MAGTITGSSVLYPGSNTTLLVTRPHNVPHAKVLVTDGSVPLSETPKPLDGNISVWFDVVANADGTITNLPYSAFLTYMESRSVRSVRVVWDLQTGEYAPLYHLVIWDDTNTIVYNYTITNTFVNGTFTFPTAIHNATRMQVGPVTWSKPGARPKMHYFGVNDFYNWLGNWRQDSFDFQGSVPEIASITLSEGSFGEFDTVGSIALTAIEVNYAVNWEVDFTGSVDVDNLYTRYQADGRRVHAKVEITYTDPFNDNTIQIEANTNYSSSTAYLIDGVTETAYPNFSLTRNDLTGYYKPLPTPIEKVIPPSWWGRQLSDIQGYFYTPEKISIKFSPRSINSLRLDGDTQLNEYPHHFYYVLYSGINQVYRTDVTWNDQVHWTHAIPETLLGVDRMELYVTKINRSNAVLKISEMFTNIVETYYTDDIAHISLLDEVGYASGSVPIGNISANEVDISLDNFDRKFDLNNSSSNLYGFVKRNRKVKVFFGAETNGEPEWLEMGTFWTTSWDIASDSLVATLTARDRLELLRQTMFDRSQLYINQTLYQLFKTILDDAGLNIGVDYELDASLDTIRIPYAWFTKQTHREALQHLASCAIIQVFCMRNGMIRVNLDLDATPANMTTYSDDVDVFSAKYPLAVTEQVNSVTVSYAGYSINATETLYEHQADIAVTDVYATDFVFSNIPVYEVSSIEMTSTNNMVRILDYNVYAWGVRIRFVNIAGGTNYITSLKFIGRKASVADKQSVLAEDTDLIMDDGRLSTTLEHPFIQTSTLATNLANTILTNYKQARYDITMEDRGNAAVHLADRIKVDNTQRTAEYMVTRMNFAWDGALSASTEGKLLKILK